MKKKVFPFGKNSDKLKPLLEKAGFIVVDKTPDFIASYGGDGTFMLSEAKYPGIPKIILRDSHICKKCSPLLNEEVLKRIAKGAYVIEKMVKLELSLGKKKFLAVNDVVVHNDNSRHAMRYKLSVNGKVIGTHIIGDGIVVSTPFGSTGYYRSITDSIFEVGIGLAFNNSTEPSDHMVLRDDSLIELSVLRGPAIAYADNQTEAFSLGAGDSIFIKKSKQTALIAIPK